jgi:glycosyltransferase involved in cell wall biosynthesis
MGALLPRKVLLLTRYDRLGASSRIRFLQFLPALAGLGFEFDIHPLFGNEYIATLYGGKKPSMGGVVVAFARRFASLLRRRRYDLVWLEKEALPWIPAWIESVLLSGIPYAVDFDDAWFHRYDLQRSVLLRLMLGGKIDAVMRQAAIVVAGNCYLAERAQQAGARQVTVIPSAIDLDRYPTGPALEPVTGDRRMVVGWIGTPVTAPYLGAIEPALRAVNAEMPVTLRIIGAKPPASFAGLTIELEPWSEATEIQSILGLDIGVMPLANTPWERGKCAYKLLQIMAAGRPVVASPVGANCEVVQPGVNGFLADATEEWIWALRALVQDEALRVRLGAAARRTVETKYSVHRVLPLLASALEQAIGEVRPDCPPNSDGSGVSGIE